MPVTHVSVVSATLCAPACYAGGRKVGVHLRQLGDFLQTVQKSRYPLLGCQNRLADQIELLEAPINSHDFLKAAAVARRFHF